MDLSTQPWNWTPRQYVNNLLGVQAYRRGEALARHRPVEVYLQVASGCNLDCYMCYEHLRPPGTRRGRGLVSMTPELYARIVAEVFPYSRKVTFGVGGEPMLSPHLLEFVETAWEHGQHVHLMTNGTRISDDRTAEVLARCLTTMEVSLDAATPETYERIRLGSKHEHMLACLERLNRYRDRAPAGERTHLTLCFVMMKSNVHELPDFVELAHRMGAEAVHAHHVIPVTDEGRADSLFEDQGVSDHFVAEARRRGLELGVEVDLPSPFAGGDGNGTTVAGAVSSALSASASVADPGARAGDAAAPGAIAAVDLARAEPTPGGLAPLPLEDPRRLPCHMPVTNVFVFYDGRVFPCCHPHAHDKLAMGDLNESSFAEIWNGRPYRNLRAGLAGGDPPPLCRVCSIVNDPPPAFEDPELGGSDLATYYGERDLAPPPESGVPDAVEPLVELGVAERLQALDRERAAQAGHIETLEGEREHLRGHVADLLRDVDLGARRAVDIETGWRAHLANVEGERSALARHLANVEAERDALRGHASNLERILDRIHGRAIYRVLGGLRARLAPKRPAPPGE